VPFHFASPSRPLRPRPPSICPPGREPEAAGTPAGSRGHARARGNRRDRPARGTGRAGARTLGVFREQELDRQDQSQQAVLTRQAAPAAGHLRSKTAT
jgi:hypothetical protein